MFIITIIGCCFVIRYYNNRIELIYNVTTQKDFTYNYDILNGLDKKILWTIPSHTKIYIGDYNGC